MGEYGSEVQFEEACSFDKEKIKSALKKRMKLSEEDPFLPQEYIPCTKEEADSIVLKAYDNAVNTGINALHCARALEKILIDHGWKYNTEEYVAALNATQRQKKYFLEGERTLYVVK